MSFVIDEEKVKELTAAIGTGGYKVSISEIKTEPNELTASLYSTTLVSGTEYDMSAVLTEARRQLLAIRKRIEESGEPLKSIDELATEIDVRRSRLR